jgi:titin
VYELFGFGSGNGNGNGSGSCTIEGLPDGTYEVEVKAYGKKEPVATSAISTFVVGPPSPATPDTVTATAGVSQVVASWEAPADSAVPITGYRATASPGAASCTTTGATSCVIGGTAGETYTVTVVALGAEGGKSAPSEPSNPATPLLPNPTDEPPDADLTLTTDEGRITTAEPGDEIVFVGTGFAGYSTVVITIYSSHTVLGTVVTDGDGEFRRLIAVPSDLPPGWHTVVALGIAPDGSSWAMTIAIEFLGLAVTGTDVAVVLLLGASLVGAGAGLHTVARRRFRRVRFIA